MKKRLQIILLLWSCILMQVASAYPHHHHADALCLHHDVETSRSANVPQGCSSECITRFNLAMPTERPVLYETVRTMAHADWMIGLFDRYFFLSDAEQTVCHCSDHPFLYASPPSGGTGLRAPPCPCTI